MKMIRLDFWGLFQHWSSSKKADGGVWCEYERYDGIRSTEQNHQGVSIIYSHTSEIYTLITNGIEVLSLILTYGSFV